MLKVHPRCSILQHFLPFEGGITFSCVYTSPFANAFIRLGAFPPFRSCEFCCSEHRDTISQDPAFSSFGYIPRSVIAGSHGNSISLRNHHTVFWLLSRFTFLPWVLRGSSFPTSLPALVHCFIFFFQYYPSLWMWGDILGFADSSVGKESACKAG